MSAHRAGGTLFEGAFGPIGEPTLAYLVLVVAGGLSILLALLGIGIEWGLPGLPLLLTPLATFAQQLLIRSRRQQLKARRSA